MDETCVALKNWYAAATEHWQLHPKLANWSICWILRPGRVKSQHGLSRLERVQWEGEECHHHRLTRRPEEFSTLCSSLVLFRVDAIVKRGKNEKKQGAASKNSIPPRYWHYYTACRADSKGRDWLFYCTFNWDCQSACSFPGPEKRHYDYHY